MFDVERLLGNMLMGKAQRRKGGFGLSKGAVGVGLLGVAMAAYEHYQEQNKAQQTPSAVPPPLPGQTQTAPPPVTPPPLPSATATPPPIPSATKQTTPASTQNMLLVDAMIAAAACDGHIDDEERQGILNQAREGGADAEAIGAIEAAMRAPKSLDDVLTAARSVPAQAENIYVASLTAIDVDTDAERNYLAQLAAGLGLPAERVQTLNDSLF